MKTTYKKVFRELKIYKGRTLLALTGIFIGIFSIGFVLSAYSILLREMDKNFMDTNPSSMVIKVKDLDNEGIELVKSMNLNADIEARKMLQGRINRNNGTYGTIYLFAVEDFNALKVDTFTLENGNFPIKQSEIVLERDSLKNLPNIKYGYNEKAIFKLPSGKEKEINLSGLIHAPCLSPASMEKFSYGFMTLEGLQALGYQGWYDEIHIVSYDNRYDREAIRTLANEIKEKLSHSGYDIEQVSVPEPGKHPHGDQLKSLLFLLQAFTVISLFVAGIIIINLFNSIMSTQVKQIAIMKATGATTRDIALPYFLYVLAISICAILISIPLSAKAGGYYSDFAAKTLNFKITNYSVPVWVMGALALSGILIPFVASFIPIYKNSKITVKEGLSERTDNKNSNEKQCVLVRLFIANANTKVKIPVNNVLRNKSRAFLGVLALAAGGLIFMTAQNMVASINKTVEESMKTFGYDYDIILANKYQDDIIFKTISEINEIDKAEIYTSSRAKFVGSEGQETSQYTIKSLPSNSELFYFQSLESGTAKNTIIINQGLRDEETWLKKGMTVTMEIKGISVDVVVADVINEVPPIPCIYMDLENYNSLFGDGTIQNIMMSVEKLSASEQLKLSARLESTLSANDIEIAENWNISLQRTSFVDHLKVIVSFLSIVAVMAVVVGGLSIASVIGINVSERKREIGVLRAIGANGHETISMFSVEATLMGFAGWFIGLLLAWPVSILAGNYFGQIFLHSDLQNTISIWGILIWFALSVSVSFVAGVIPAKSAVTAPLREMLSYE